MLHISTRNTDGITDAVLPPRTSRGKFRLLAITTRYVGLSSVAQEFERYAASHDDVELVSVRYHPPVWARIVARPLKAIENRGIYEYSAERSLWATRRFLDSWFPHRLPLDRFDGIHCTTQHLAVGVLDRRPRGCAVSVYLDATQMNVVEQWGDSPRWAKPMVREEQRIFDECDVIASNSEWVTRSLEKDYHVSRSKVILTPPSCEVLARPDLAPGQPVPVRKPRILFIGNGWVRKGGPDLLRWHQERWKDWAELHVVSAECSGPPAPGVVWHGKISRDRLLNEVVPSCDLLCLPTTRDMSPWVVAEATASGLPVVATRLAGIPELMEEGKSGILVDLGDEAGFIEAIERLLHNRELCREMGRAGIEFARRSLAREVVFGRIVNALRAAAPNAGASVMVRREPPAIGVLDGMLRARRAMG